MPKLLMCFDGPLAVHLAQTLPVAYCFGRYYDLDCLTLNPVTTQFWNEVPFVRALPIKLKEDGLIYELPHEEAMTANTDYYYTAKHTLGKGADFSASLKEKINSYDRILLLYDKQYRPVMSLFLMILRDFNDKSFGRVGPWIRNAAAFDPDKYSPREAVEAFGYKFHDSMVEAEYDWFKAFDPQLEIQERSICLNCSAGCEVFLPDNDDRTLTFQSKLIRLLKEEGFQIIPTNRKEGVRKQLFYSKCTYYLGVDSIFPWVYRAFKNSKDIHLIQPVDFPHLEVQLGLENLLKGVKPNPEAIVKLFLAKIRPKIL